jgi:hypothetical protein
MSSPNATDTRPEAAPTEEQFWGKYNAHYEFPIGTALSVLAHVLIVAVLVFGFLGLMNLGQDTTPVRITSLGEDDAGDGRPDGDDEQPRQLGGSAADSPRPEQMPELADVKKVLEEDLRVDPGLDGPIPDNMAEAFKALDIALRGKLLDAAKRGGSGASGPGADSTRARGLRWVLRFNTRTGRDYLNQLAALKAVVMIPVPPDNKRMLILRDPAHPRADEYATDADIREQAAKVQFQDARRASNEAIREALGLPATPAAFWAFFPKSLEDEMARLEVAYRNKRPEDIRETVFQVEVIGGAARLIVVAQRAK